MLLQLIVRIFEIYRVGRNSISRSPGERNQPPPNRPVILWGSPQFENPDMRQVEQEENVRISARRANKRNLKSPMQVVCCGSGIDRRFCLRVAVAVLSAAWRTGCPKQALLYLSVITATFTGPRLRVHRIVIPRLPCVNC